MDPYTTPDARKKMYTPSGAFEWHDEPPQPSLDRFDVLGFIAAALLCAGLLIVAWKAVPKVVEGIHAAEETSRLIERGY